MSDVRSPVQARSRKTLETLLEAAERLLVDRPFDDISVQDLVSAARASTGSFYARFPSKEAMLPALYARYEERLSTETMVLLDRLDETSSLFDACRVVAATFANMYRDQPFLMRAMAALAREAPDRPKVVSPERARIHRAIESALVRFAPDGAVQPESAVRAALFMASCTLRERVLYPHAPFASQSRSADEAETTVAKMMKAYLEGEWS